MNDKVALDPSYNILYLAGTITNSLSNMFNRMFRQARIDITVEQFSVLALLWYKEGMNQQEIANSLNRDKTTITRVLENMFRKNLLVKATDQADRRNKRIFLTQKGKELQDKSLQLTNGVYTKVMANLDEGEMKSTLKVLNTINENLK